MFQPLTYDGAQYRLPSDPSQSHKGTSGGHGEQYQVVPLQAAIYGRRQGLRQLCPATLLMLACLKGHGQRLV